LAKKFWNPESKHKQHHRKKGKGGNPDRTSLQTKLWKGDYERTEFCWHLGAGVPNMVRGVQIIREINQKGRRGRVRTFARSRTVIPKAECAARVLIQNIIEFLNFSSWQRSRNSCLLLVLHPANPYLAFFFLFGLGFSEDLGLLVATSFNFL
jgi:hypothetical protein